MRRISVIGLDGRPLSPEAGALIDEAVLVVGGKRHLESLNVEPERSAVLKGDLSEAMELVEVSDGLVTVLASGDPGFFGIVRLLRERFDTAELRVLPALSSVALACAHAGLPWEDAAVVSAHGRDGRSPRRAVNVCRSHPKVAVLTSPDFGPAELAHELESIGRSFVVAERLGETDERVFHGDAVAVAEKEWRDPNLVLVLDEARMADGKSWVSGLHREPGGWALPESEFEHRSAMITKPEVRSLVLARLGPAPGDLVWDVGAGSGSVGIECAHLGAATIAIERDPESCARICRNAARHDVCVEVVEGEASAVLHALPEPDTVFVGGTGGSFEEIVKLAAVRARRAVVLTLITLERVIPAAEILGDCGLEVETIFLQASRVKGVGALHRLASETPVFVVSGSRP